jgi:serine/threonine protein kinase
MPDNYDGWQIIDELGKGGQGTVYRARSPERVEKIRSLLEALRVQFRGLSNDYGSKEMAECIVALGSPDNVEHVGALKRFDIPEGFELATQMGFTSSASHQEAVKARGRLENEILALRTVQHAAALKLLYSNPTKRFIVTEYHPNGTLGKHLDRYKGRPSEALEAFRPLADAVRAIHEQKVIHRDIKTGNIFVAADGRLVLGDFGIVFFKDGSDQRLTTTLEKVGTS